MAKKGNKTDDQFAQIEETLSKTEQYIENNQENLVKIVGAIVVVIALFIGYQKFYIAPMEKEAQAEMFMAEIYFQKDSFNLALNGDGQYLGFIDIADEYSGIKAGALANYYAGLSYLNTGDFENAIEYLDDFSSDDIVLSSLALGCIGDAYMELGDTDNALAYYEDAVSNSENELTAPRYMLKQAMIHEKNGDYDDALALYKGIEADYKSSREGNGIEKYIARAENR
ncbi:MAG TPA: tetratricopeptide repeat protein [Flavobacteriales bacterium]|jgi:tetratricopeptide (TPR) repeat protein|nr:tetratricopeptide repeat protein [Flavobacteriales bacterium]